MTRFGLGSIARMALASGAAAVTLRIIFRSGGARRGLALVTGALSITVGVMGSIPLWSRR
jgi:hypothetical protein